MSDKARWYFVARLLLGAFLATVGWGVHFLIIGVVA